MSKGLRFFDKIKDILIFIEKKTKEKEIILSENLDFLKLKFKINLPDGKEHMIGLEIKKTKFRLYGNYISIKSRSRKFKK